MYGFLAFHYICISTKHGQRIKVAAAAHQPMQRTESVDAAPPELQDLESRRLLRSVLTARSEGLLNPP
jgi:hypothetical protein